MARGCYILWKTSAKIIAANARLDQLAQRLGTCVQEPLWIGFMTSLKQIILLLLRYMANSVSRMIILMIKICHF